MLSLFFWRGLRKKDLRFDQALVGSISILINQKILGYRAHRSFKSNDISIAFHQCFSFLASFVEDDLASVFEVYPTAHFVKLTSWKKLNGAHLFHNFSLIQSLLSILQFKASSISFNPHLLALELVSDLFVTPFSFEWACIARAAVPRYECMASGGSPSTFETPPIGDWASNSQVRSGRGLISWCRFKI